MHPKIVSSRLTFVLISIILLAFQTKTNAQEGVYWTGLSMENPALIGTPSDWVWGAVSFADIPNYDDGYSNIALYSDCEISPKVGSVGANFTRLSMGKQTAYLAELAYAYTLTAKKNREWNFGASCGTEGITTNFESNNAKANYLGMFINSKSY